MREQSHELSDFMRQITRSGDGQPLCRHEWLVESSLLIINVPGTYVAQGESRHDVIMFVECHHGIIILDRPGDLWNPAFSSVIKDQDKRWHRVPMKSARISRR
jgi:hypothetical protein